MKFLIISSSIVLQQENVIFQEFSRKCQYLTQFPYLGKSYGHLLTDLRGLPLDGYIILYRATKQEVEILRIVYGRQNLEELFKDF